MIVNTKFFAFGDILIGNGRNILGKYDNLYDVHVTTDGNGDASSDKNKGYAGDVVNLSNSPHNGYVFDAYNVNGTDIAGSSFVISEDTNVIAKFNKLYNVSVSTDGHGTAVANPSSAIAGTTIQLSNTPDSNYAFDHYTVNGTSTTNSSFTINGDTNVVAYFAYQYGTNDWYYDDDNSQNSVQNRTLTNCQIIAAHQRFTVNPDPTKNQRQSWSNYGVCKYTANGAVSFMIDGMPGLSKEDHIAVNTTGNIALVIDFVNRVAKVYRNGNLYSTTNLRMQCNGVFLGIYPSALSTTVSKIYMKIFNKYDDALHYALS